MEYYSPLDLSLHAIAPQTIHTDLAGYVYHRGHSTITGADDDTSPRSHVRVDENIPITSINSTQLTGNFMILNKEGWKEEKDSEPPRRPPRFAHDFSSISPARIVSAYV